VEEAPTMNRDAGVGLLRRTPSRPGVRRSIRDLALLVAGSPLGLRRSPGQAPLSTQSHMQCGPQSRPDIDTWCATSSSRPAAG
jgi:hypothetical protein